MEFDGSAKDNQKWDWRYRYSSLGLREQKRLYYSPHGDGSDLPEGQGDCNSFRIHDSIIFTEHMGSSLRSTAAMNGDMARRVYTFEQIENRNWVFQFSSSDPNYNWYQYMNTSYNYSITTGYELYLEGHFHPNGKNSPGSPNASQADFDNYGSRSFVILFMNIIRFY